MPELPLAFRGYSRPAVDDHVAALETALAAAQAAYEQAADQAAAARAQLQQLRAERDAARGEAAPLQAEAKPGAVRVFQEPTVEAPVAAPPAEKERPLAVTLPRPAPTTTGRRGRHLILPAVALVVAAVATALVVTKDDDPAAPAAAPPRASTAASPATSLRPSPAASPAVVATPPRPVALRAVPPIPAGWESYRDPQGQYAVGLPLSWRSAGADRFLSASGKSELLISTGASDVQPTVAELAKREKAFAGRHPGYHRIGLAVVPFHGLPAGVWSYTYGRGAATSRASELIVLVDGHLYRLRAASRAQSWRFVQPLVARFRATLHPRGLSA